MESVPQPFKRPLELYVFTVKVHWPLVESRRPGVRCATPGPSAPLGSNRPWRRAPRPVRGVSPGATNEPGQSGWTTTRSGWRRPDGPGTSCRLSQAQGPERIRRLPPRLGCVEWVLASGSSSAARQAARGGRRATGLHGLARRTNRAWCGGPGPRPAGDRERGDAEARTCASYGSPLATNRVRDCSSSSRDCGHQRQRGVAAATRRRGETGRQGLVVRFVRGLAAGVLRRPHAHRGRGRRRSRRRRRGPR